MTNYTLERNIRDITIIYLAKVRFSKVNRSISKIICILKITRWRQLFALFPVAFQWIQYYDLVGIHDGGILGR